jgi:hypothetical protein
LASPGKECKQDRYSQKRIQKERKMKKYFALLAMATALAITPAALAETTWNFTITGDGISGSGTITGSLDTSISSDAYDITAITGTFSDGNVSISGPITGLAPASWNGGNGTYYPVDGVFGWQVDNVFYPSGDAATCNFTTGGQLDQCGLFFAVGSYDVNVYSNGTGYTLQDFDATAYNLDPNAALAYGTDPDPDNSMVLLNGEDVDFSATPAATPEPGSLLLLGTGLVGLAGMLRRKQRA